MSSNFGASIIPQFTDTKYNSTVATSPIKTTQSTDTPSPKNNNELSTGSKLTLAAGIAAAATIGILLAKGHFSQAKKVFEHINFTQAKTKEEAIKYAQETLGIKSINSEMPLDVLNWANKGFTDVVNVTKGKAKMPQVLEYQQGGGLACFTHIDEYGDVININKQAIENLDTTLTEVISDLSEKNILPKLQNGAISILERYYCRSQHDEFLKLINKFTRAPKDVKFDEKMKIYEALSNLQDAHIKFYDTPLVQIKALLGHEKVSEVCKTLNLPKIEALEKLTVEEQTEYLNKILARCHENNIPITVKWHFNDGVYGIYHEMAHLQHYHKIGSDKFYSMNRPQNGEATEITNEFLQNKEKQQIASTVTSYAQESPLEFVAETYRRLIEQKIHPNSNISLSEDVLKLYREYHGPEI